MTTKLIFSIGRGDSLPVYFYASAEIDSIKIDTSLNQFQKYIFRNTLGNIGLAENPLAIIYADRKMGFQYSTNYFEKYYFNSGSQRFFSTIKPYTDVNVFLGQKKEQVFRLIHTQNVNRRLNFSVEFNRTRSEGWYLRQNVNHNNLAFASNYINKKNNYMLFFSGTYNNLQVAENGGIENDSIFENIDLRDKKLLAVHLPAAQRRLINSGFFAKQNFYFGKRDSDSTKIFKRSSCFSHSVNFENNKWVYEDNNPSLGYYPAILEDSINTLDSVQYYLLENTFSLELLKKKAEESSRNLYGAAFITHQYADLISKNGFMDSLVNNIIAGIKLETGSRKLNLSFLADYVVTGNNNNDYKAKFNLSFGNDSTSILSFSANIDKRTPDLIYGNYFSNHFSWNNSFDKTISSYQRVSLLVNKYKMEYAATFYQYSNYLYFDNYSKPRQLEENLYSFSFLLKKDFKFKHFVFSNKLIYQYVPDSTVLRFPSFISSHSLYYENSLFKKALDIQVGADVFYYSAYFANAYMPALTQYYIQNEKSIGNYPFIDVFLNMKIKNARIFIKMEHVNSGLLGNYYYAVPNMPYFDRAFKVGINWKFYD